ncbi:MAG: tRNA (guanosine(37)-N1)-methyltransferase TrmD [Acidobacteriota bacterium]|nr:tRNA (guanosine(37)-N1)-methyltransferase TrmD [Acidobacteriota bacterium]
MTLDVVTIFPDMVRHALDEGIIGRAVDNAVVAIGVRDLREHTTDKHRTVDDVPFGGGPGMVLKPEPLFRAVKAIEAERGAADAVVLMSPQGRRLTHAEAARFSRMARVIVICGRYEGVDERVVEALVTDEISIGDYVLTGGELPALVFIDAVVRLVPGVVGDAQSVEEDSFAAGVLDHPHYTRPAEFEGRAVPAVLLSGHHAEIDRWRRRERLRRTLERRPDLLERAEGLGPADRAVLDELRKGQ